MDWKKRSIKRVARVTGDISVTPTESTVSNWCSEKVYWALPVSGQLRALLVVVVIQGIAISNTMCESSCVKERFLSHKMKYSIFPMVSKISTLFLLEEHVVLCWYIAEIFVMTLMTIFHEFQQHHFLFNTRDHSSRFHVVFSMESRKKWIVFSPSRVSVVRLVYLLTGAWFSHAFLISS